MEKQRDYIYDRGAKCSGVSQASLGLGNEVVRRVYTGFLYFGFLVRQIGCKEHESRNFLLHLHSGGVSLNGHH